MGCDTNSSGTPQGAGYKGTRIALARIYCKALSADEATAYEAAQLYGKNGLAGK